MNHFPKRLLLKFPIYFGMIVLVWYASVVSAEEPRFLKESFPGGFSLKESVKFYDAGNLYEYINGQAVFYLSYRFNRLEHGYYKNGGSEFYVDVYELGSRLSAFGSYRQQREDGAGELYVGCEGAITDYLAVFHKGKYYVEIIPMGSGTDDLSVMKILAGHVEKNIPGETDLPPEVGLFPKEALIAGSERYVGENFLSYSFMGRGLNAVYQIEGQEKDLRIFIALADSESKAEGIFDSYRERLQNPSSVRTGTLEGLKGSEPYRGTTIIFSWKGYVFGCLGAENETKALDLVKTLHDNLK
ncbi:DUF6599 family protein [Candidatus Latescibacterota bacterium]